MSKQKAETFKNMMRGAKAMNEGIEELALAKASDKLRSRQPEHSPRDSENVW